MPTAGYMDDGLALPWWDYTPARLALPGSVVNFPEKRGEEATVAAFLQAGSRAETAARFIAANSLKIAGVLEFLAQDELVLPTQERLEEAEGAFRSQTPSHCRSPRGSSTDRANPSIRCRSKLLGLPLADRHAALMMACSFGHMLPRRALVDFLCRLVLGDGVTHVQAGLRHRIIGEENKRAEARRRNGSCCSCGGQALFGIGDAEIVGARSSGTQMPVLPPHFSTSTCAACKACLACREWLDSFSARLLTGACRKLLFTASLPEEILALNRCLVALSGALMPPKPVTPWPDAQWEKGTLRPNSWSDGPSSSDRIAGSSSGKHPAPDTLVMSAENSGNCPKCSDQGVSRREWTEVGARRPISTILAGVRKEQRHNKWGRNVNDKTALCSDIDRRDGENTPGMGKRSRDVVSTGSSSQPPSRKVAKAPAVSLPSPRNHAGSPGVAVTEHKSVASIESTEQLSVRTTWVNTDDSITGIREARAPPDGEHQAPLTNNGSEGAAKVAGHDTRTNTQDRGGEEGEEREEREEDYLPTALRETMTAVSEKLAAAGARGAPSGDLKTAAAATVLLLQDAVSASAHPMARRAFAQQNQERKQQPFEVVCKGLGLDKPAGKESGGEGGCGDDLVMAVCNGFVTSALSLRNCLAFFSAVLVPRARSLSGPASRLLVTAVSGIGKARPGAAIDGLILPLLCDTDPQDLGSAQCELCTRLIKQVLPKHTLEAVLCGLCGGPTMPDAGGGGRSVDPGAREGGKFCVWTELTMPIITAALNLKPLLSDKAIGVLVRKVEAASEQPELQKSLKFTTLVHSLVTRYGPQAKPHVATVRMSIGRCSTFMVKTVLGALQRLDK